jgi:hypothetical protein
VKANASHGLLSFRRGRFECGLEFFHAIADTCPLFSMKVSMCSRSRLGGCSEAYYPSQICRVRPHSLMELEIPDPGELVLQFLETMFEA